MTTEGYSNSETNAANAGRNDPSKQFNVNDWNAQNGNSNIGLVPAVVSSNAMEAYPALSFVWWNESILQAFCLFLVAPIQVLNICCFVLPDCLLQVLKELLLGQLWC